MFWYRDVQHTRAPEAQALDKAVPQSLSLSPSEQLIMEVSLSQALELSPPLMMLNMLQT